MKCENGFSKRKWKNQRWKGKENFKILKEKEKKLQLPIKIKGMLAMLQIANYFQKNVLYWKTRQYQSLWLITSIKYMWILRTTRMFKYFLYYWYYYCLLCGCYSVSQSPHLILPIHLFVACMTGFNRKTFFHSKWIGFFF